MDINRTTLYSILVIICAIATYSLIIIHNTVYWFDESYSVSLIQHSFTEIWAITAQDVHPPLYYYMLKVFGSCTSHTMLNYRILSLVGVCAIFILGLFPVKKYFGEKASLFFILLVAIMPVTQYLASDIRMYSWLMFFVTWTSLNAYAVYKGDSKFRYFLLLISAICAAYIHYYGLMSCCIIFFILFLHKKISKKKSIGVIAITILFLFSYIFWIENMIQQINTVNNHFWIYPLTPKDLLLLIYYSFSPKDPSHPYMIFNVVQMSVVLSTMLVLIGLCFIDSVYLFRKRIEIRDSIKKTIPFFLICTILLVVTVSYSFIIKPVIIPRYTNTVLGCFLIGLSILFSIIYDSNKKGKLLIIITCCLFFILSTARFFSERKYISNEIKTETEIDNFFAKNKSDKSVYISTFHTWSILGMFNTNYPQNISLVFNPIKTNWSYKPFNLIEINKLPTNFDFYYIKDNADTIDYKYEIQDIYFMENIKKDVTIVDSLIQKKLSIYRMKTIHRD